MGNAVNVSEFTRHSLGRLESTGSGRTMEPWTGRVGGSDRYAEGGDFMSIPVGGVIASVKVIPEFDGGTHVAWNGDPDDPRLRISVFGDGEFVEVPAGSDQTKVVRHVEVNVLV